MEGKGGTRQILFQYFVERENTIDLSRIIPQLIARETFTLQDEREIVSYHAHADQVTAFVDILGSKGWDGFFKCCDLFEKAHPKLLTTFLMEFQGESSSVLST